LAPPFPRKPLRSPNVLSGHASVCGGRCGAANGSFDLLDTAGAARTDASFDRRDLLLFSRLGGRSCTAPGWQRLCPYHGGRHVRGRPGDNQPRGLHGGDRRRECRHWETRTWDGDLSILPSQTEGVPHPVLPGIIRLLLRLFQHSRNRKWHGHRLHWLYKPVYPLHRWHRATSRLHLGVRRIGLVGHRRTGGYRQMLRVLESVRDRLQLPVSRLQKRQKRVAWSTR
jgi:hypothetical protein